ncbi:serine acetyltransferase [Oscillospiraceae bacterium NSJ-64]|uniref:Serine acetyltransferase n=2 Tax=Youxingia wuxianensis TaxID=2763678 RepID=A0A926ESG6_9FIRM|nr:serine acetyltransferase [Youxingia wuxianensis]
MRLTYSHYFMRRGSFIGLGSQMETTPCFPHGVQGIFISEKARIGKDAVIFQQVTIGSNSLKNSAGYGAPVLGNNVYIGAGAKIIGRVTIGNNCRIGANAVVYQDMPDNSVAVCAPTRILQKENLDNTHVTVLGGIEYYYEDGRLHTAAK